MRLASLRCIARLFFIIGGLAAGSAAHAQTYTWNNTTGTGTLPWSGLNWDVAPISGSTTTLQFDATGTADYNAQNDLLGTFVLNALKLNSSSTNTITISGNPIEFQTDLSGPTFPELQQNNTGAVDISNDLVLTDNVTISGTGTGLVTLSGAITGLGTLTMNNGVGETVLTNATNNYAGTTITAGRLVATAVGALGGTNAVNLNGGILAIRSDTGLVFTNAINVTANSIIESSRATTGTAATQTLGALTINGGSQLSISAGSLLNANTPYTVTMGATSFGAAGATFEVNNNGTGTGSLTLGSLNTAARSFTKTGAGNLNLSAAIGTWTGTITITQGAVRTTINTALNGSSAINLNGGTYQIANATAANNTGTITVSAPSSLILGAGGAGVAYTNSGGLSIGSTTLSVSETTTAASSYTMGASTFSGNPTIAVSGNGALTTNFILGAVALGTGQTRTLTVNNSATTGFLSLSAAATGTNSAIAAIVNSGNFRLQSGNALVATTGTPSVTMNGGSLQLHQNTGTSFATGTVTIAGNSTIFTQRASGTGAGVTHTIGALSVGAFTLTVQANNNTTTSGRQGLTTGAVTLTGNAIFNINDNLATAFLDTTLGAISESSAGLTLTKNGTGTLVYNAAANYTGGTSVTNGLLQLNTVTAVPGTGSIAISTAAALALNNFASDADVVTALSTVTAGSSGSIAIMGTTNVRAIDLATPGLTSAFVGATSNAAVSYTGTFTTADGIYRLGGGGGALTFTPSGGITSGSIIVGGATSGATVGQGGSVILSDNLTHSGLTTVNAATLTLSGNNSGASGGVTLNAGTLNINNNDALGTGTFTINGGTINSGVAGITVAGIAGQNWNAAFTFTGTNALNLGTTAVTLGAPVTATITATSLTVGGPIGGSFGLTKAGAGTLVLAGSGSTYTTTAVSAGILSIRGNSAAGTGTISTTGAATIDLASDSNLTLTNGVTIGAATTINVNRVTPDAIAMNHTIGSITSGAFTTTFAAGTGITAGTAWDLTVTGAATLTGNTNFTINNNGAGLGTVTVGNLALSTFTLTKAGAGQLVINGTTTGTGALTPTAGTVVIGSATALTASNPVTFGAASNGTLRLNGNSLTIGALTSAAATTPTIENASITPATLTISSSSAGSFAAGTIQDGTGGGALSLAKAGTGVQTLAGSSTYTGGTSITGGALQFSTIASVPTTGTILVGPNAAAGINLAAPADIITALAAIDAASTGSVAVGANSAAVAFDLTPANLAGVYFGAVGAVTYTGTLTPNVAGVWRLGGGTGTLTYNTAITSTDSVFIGPSAGTGGGGTVVFAGATTNDFSGGLTIQNNTLRVGDATNAPSFYLGTGAVTLNGGTLDLRNDAGATISQSVNMGTAGGLVVNRVTSAATATTHTITNFAIPTGTQALSITQGGNITGATAWGLTLTNLAVTGSGTFTITNGTGTGTLMISNVTGAGGITKAGNGVLTFNTPSAGFTGTLTSNAGTTNVSAALAGATALTVGGGTTNVTASMAGLTQTTITAGTLLNQGAADNLGSSPIALSGGAAFNINGTTASTAMTGLGDNNVTVSGTGTATITIGNTASSTNFTTTLGTLSIGTQTLSLVRGSTFTSNNLPSLTFGAVTLAGSPTFAVPNSGSGNATLTLGAVTGAGTITKNGLGNLTIAASPAWTGAIVQTAGSTTSATTLSGNNGLTADSTLSGGTLSLRTSSGLGGTNMATANDLNISGGTLALRNNASTSFFLNANVTNNATILVGNAAATGSPTHTIGILTIGTFNLTTDDTSIASNSSYALATTSTVLTGNPRFIIDEGSGTGSGFINLGSVDDGGTARTITVRGGGAAGGAAVSTLIFGSATNVFEGSFNIGDSTGTPLPATLDLRGSTQISTSPIFTNGSILRIRPVTQVGSGTNVGALGTLTSLTLTTGAIFEGASAAANTTYGIDLNVTGNSTVRTALQAAGSGVTNTYGNLAIDGNTLTINPGANVNAATAYGVTLGSATFTTAAPTFTVNANTTGAGTLTLGAVTDNGFGFTKNGTVTGTSTLILAAANNPALTGTINVSNGTLEIQGSTAIGAAPVLSANTILRVRTAAALNGNTLNLPAATIFEGQSDTAATIAVDLSVTGDATVRAARVTAGGGVELAYGNITIGTFNLTIAPGINVSNNTNYGVSFSSLTMASDPTLTVNNNGTGIGTLTLGAVTGTGIITKTGAGILVIDTASPSWTGGFTQTAGTTNFNASTGIGSPIVVNGGTVNANAANSFTNGATVHTGTLLLANIANAFSGASTINSGAGIGLTVTGAFGGADNTIAITSGGILFATYDLDTATVAKATVSSVGVIALGADSSNALDFSTTTARLGAVGEFTTSGTITPNGTTYNLGGGGTPINTSTLIVTSLLMGAGNSVNIGTGGTLSGVVILRPTANNTYDGGTTVTTGATLFVVDDTTVTALGAPSGALTLDGGTFILGSATAFNPARTLSFGASGGTLNTNGFNTTLDNAVTGNFTKSGAGTVTSTVAAGSPFGGGVITANAGGLTLAPTGNGSVALTDSTGATDTFTYNGITLRLDKGTNTDLRYTLGGAGTTFPLVRGVSNPNVRGTLALDAASGRAAFNTAGGESFVLSTTTAPDVTAGGIYSPSVVLQTGNPGSRIGDFVATTGASPTINFTLATYTSSDVATSIATDVVNQTTGTTLTVPALASALRLGDGTGAVTLAQGTNSLTLGNGTGTQGGLILNNASTTAGAGGTIAFGAAEGIIFVGDGTNTLGNPLITGSGGLTLFGPGTLSITSTAAVTGAYSGGLVINGATLSFSGFTTATTDTWALGIGGAGNPITLNAGTLRLAGNSYDQVANKNIVLGNGGGTFEVTGALNYTINDASQLSGSGNLNKTGTGTLTVGAAAVGYSGFTGTTTISSGTLRVLNAASLGTGTGELSAVTVTATGAALEVAGTGVPKMVFVSGTGISGAGAIINAQTTSGSLTGRIDLVGNTSIGVANTGSLTISGLIENFGTGTRSLTKVSNGTGALILAGSANTYDGGTTISAGILQANSNGALGAATTSLTINGGTFRYGAVIAEIGNASRPTTIGASGATFDTNGFDNTLGSADLTVNAAASFNKAGAGSLIIPTMTYSGQTGVHGGTLIPTAAMTLTAGTNTYVMGAAAGATSVGTLDLATNSVDATFGGTMTVRTNNVAANVISLGTQTMEVRGAVTIGTAGNATTRLNITGTGAALFTIGTAASPTNLGFQLGNNVTSNVSNAGILDMSGLSNFFANLGTGTFRVGDLTNGGGGATLGSTLTLAATSEIRATTITSDSPDSGVNQAIRLGLTSNILRANTINIGGTASGRTNGTLEFSTGTGTVQIRALDGTGRAAVNVAHGGTTTGGSPSATVDFTGAGHSADLLISTLGIGGRTANGGSSTGTFRIENTQGVGFDVTGIVMGRRANTSANAGTSTATLDILGGTTVIGTGGISMSNNTATFTPASQVSTSTVNISGGTVSIGESSGTSITMGTATTALAQANATINFTGGTTTVNGNIIQGTATGVVTSIINLDGGSLDMTDKNIGTNTNQITFNAKSGTLSNLNELNGGLTGLAKDTNGTLVLLGSNDYTGGTTVAAGTLRVSGTITDSAGTVSVAALATLSGGGTIHSAVTVAPTGNLSPGNSPGTLTVTNNVILDSGSLFNWEISGTLSTITPAAMNTGLSSNTGLSTQDQLLVTGALKTVTAGDITVNILQINDGSGSTLTLNPYDSYSFTLMSSDPGTTASLGGLSSLNFSGAPDFQNYIADGGTITLSAVDNVIYLNLQAVPEPTSVGLIAAGGLWIGTYIRRRRVRRSKALAA